MKEIKQFIINSSAISKKRTSRPYEVHGDPGASFSLIVTNEDDNYYNFPDSTTIGEEKPSPAFAAAIVESSVITLNQTGVHYGFIVFSAVTDDDHYEIKLMAKQDSTISSSLSFESSYFASRIYQYDDPLITFSLLHSDSAVVEPSNVTSTGISSRVGASGVNKFSISWPVTLGSSNFIIARQPIGTDFEFTTTKDTKTAGSSSKTLELKNIENLSVGMVVSGTGVASGSVITSIVPGYRDYTNTSLNDIYVIPLVVENINGKDEIVGDKGGTVIIDKASTFVVDRTLTFTGKGSVAAKIFSGVNYSISNFSLTIDPVVTTTDAAVANSTTIPVTSTNGVKAADTVLMSGIGVTATAPHVDTVNAGVSVVVSAAQTIENGQTVTFTGSSRAANINLDVEIASYGKSDLTLTLNLNNILTVE